MAVYLVMINNLKRVFQKKWTYLWMLLIPLVIGLMGYLSTQISEKSIRVGILNCSENNILIEELEKMDYVQYRIADSKTIHADHIMGTYHYVIDGCNEEEAHTILNDIQTLINEKVLENSNDLSSAEREVAMIMTVYLVIATLYASKVIEDRETGTLERYCLSGNKKLKYFTGYVLSTLLIVLIQVTIAFLVLLILHKTFLPDGNKILLTILVITGAATLYGVFHSILYKRQMTANIMSSSIAILLSILGGTFVAVDQMPAVLQWVSAISPIRWILELIK